MLYFNSHVMISNNCIRKLYQKYIIGCNMCFKKILHFLNNYYLFYYVLNYDIMEIKCSKNNLSNFKSNKQRKTMKTSMISTKLI